jgi:transposase
MTQKRRKYTREYKEEAVKLVTEQGYRISETARNLGINENMLGRWKQELLNEKEDGGSGRAGKSELELENHRLQKEIKRLQMEREILKKAAAFFAKEMS